jgi:hypothetical protein
VVLSFIAVFCPLLNKNYNGAGLSVHLIYLKLGRKLAIQKSMKPIIPKLKLSNLSTSLKQMSPLFLSFFMGAGTLAAFQKVSSLQPTQTVNQQIEIQGEPSDEINELGKIASPFWEISQNQEELFKFSDFLTIDQETTPQLTEATPDLILSDFQNRVDAKFAIPDLIFNQTKFWFRIYT